MICLQTSANSRVIKKAIQALIKAKAATSAYKLQYAKKYIPDESGRIKTQTIQIIMIVPDSNRSKSSTNILSNILIDFDTFSFSEEM